MAIVVESFNGTDINTANYTPRIYRHDMPETHAITPVVVRPSGRNGRTVRADMLARTIPIHIFISGLGVGAGQLALAQVFQLGTEGELVVTYDGVSRALTGRVDRVIMYDGVNRMFTVVLAVEDGWWHSAAVVTTSRQQTVSAATWTVANAGNSPDYAASVTVSPVTTKLTANGFLYKREVIVANRATRGFVNYALDVTGVGIDHAALTTAKSLTSGNDMRVRVDGVEVPRWPGENAATGWDVAATRLWVNIDLSPCKTATLLTAAASGASPADGADWEVVKGGTTGWPSTGAFLVGDECITYTGITTKNANGREAFTGIDRAARNSTGAAHSVGDILYWIERRVQIIYGYSGAAAPDARNERKPMLDFTSATCLNGQHEWLDFAHATDPRSMQWSRRYVPSRDDQAQFIRCALGSPQAALTFEYDKDGPGVGVPTFNQWERDFPSGTDGNIAFTRVIDDTMALQIFSVDADGNELKGTTGNVGLVQGAVASASANHDPGDVYALRIVGFNQIIASAPQPRSLQAGDGISNDFSNMFQFTTGDQPIVLTAVKIFAYDDNTGKTITCFIYGDTNGDLAAGGVGVGEISSGSFSPLDNSATERTIPMSAVTLSPNTKYWCSFRDGGTTNVVAYYQYMPYRNAAGTYQHTKLAGTNVTGGQGFVFRFVGYPAPLADSLVRLDLNCLADDQDVASITAIVVPLLATGVPYVSMKAEENIAWLNGTLSNDTTGQTVALDLICTLADVITIDIANRTVRNTTKNEDVFFAAKFSDAAQWLRLNAGNNTFKWTETGIVRTDIVVNAHDRYQ